MNDWISVKERLPEKDGWYFVYAPEKITGGLKEKWGKDTL